MLVDLSGAMPSIIDSFIGLQRSLDAICHIRLQGVAGSGRSRLLNEFAYLRSLPLEDPKRQEGFNCVHLLLETPTGVLSDYRKNGDGLQT